MTGIQEHDWPAEKVRHTFLDFFQEKNHRIWPSSSVVPEDDPSLLFANAGMNQFKPIFLGTVQPNLKRACNSQKCIRAGGKHNDLDDVGKDTYHHTFFEMLGNWSFGDDYFKVEAISWAWELLTQVYNLPSDRIYATYFGGDGKVEADDEARDIWLKFFPPDRVLPFGSKDNFWEMGILVLVDLVQKSILIELDPTCIEIWNLVFIQFNRETKYGPLTRLSMMHVDTGMGFERLTSILQNKTSNYDTDLFMPIFDAIQQTTRVRPYSGRVGADDVDKIDTAYRVVAYHIRTLCFAIADGSGPGNGGREHVLRRILRRGVRYGHEVLKGENGFFSGLVGVVVELMGNVYPELKQHEKKIREIIEKEETSFGKTLLKGIEMFKKMAKKVQGGVFSGEDAFLLWDRHGLPLDITQLMAEDQGLVVDVEGYENAKVEVRNRSRSGMLL
ncbi:hypothetical protein MKX03_012533 [Papaver bracteatum]|nr:hypothetical protein MKX03_012533 [Papaver bracteatum]